MHEDTLGELGVYTLLLEAQSSRSKARLASLGWDGDVLRRYRTAGGEDVIIAYGHAARAGLEELDPGGLARHPVDAAIVAIVDRFDVDLAEA